MKNSAFIMDFITKHNVTYFARVFYEVLSSLTVNVTSSLVIILVVL